MKLKVGTLIFGVSAVAASFQSASAETISYLDPVVGVAGTSGFVTRTADCTVHEAGLYGGQTWESGWHAVRGTVVVSSRLKIDGDVRVILCDGAELRVNEAGSDGGGVFVGSGETLAIHAQSVDTNAMGALTAKGGARAAGIGGTSAIFKGDSGAIVVNGGRITATGGYHAAGIGGGGGSISGNGRNITINGGLVTATGGQMGAGIGGGYNGRGEDITINGGTVIATPGAATVDGCVAASIGDGGAFPQTDTRNIVFAGGSVWANGVISGGAPVNAAGEFVYKTTVTGVTESPAQIAGLSDYAVAGLYPQGGTLVFYLPSGSCSFHSGMKRYSGDAGTTLSPLGDYYGITVNGVEAGLGSGEGWTCANDVLTLSEERGYTLAGEDGFGRLRVDVTTNATVTLHGIRLVADTPGRAIVSVTATDARLVLSGTSTVYANDGNAAIDVAAGARLEVRGQRSDSGDGDCLVGGRASGANGRGFHVAGELVLEGGTIRNYFTSDRCGAGVYCSGSLTMRGGAIADCQLCGTSDDSLFGAGVSFARGAVGTFESGRISGCRGQFGCGFACPDGNAAIAIGSGMVFSGNVANSGGSVCCALDCTIDVRGGTFRDNSERSLTSPVFMVLSGSLNFSGGVMTGNTGSFFTDYTATVRGGAFQSAPDAAVIAAGFEAKKAGALYVVGQDVDVRNDEIAGGTYAFNPTNGEYVAAGVTVSRYATVTALGTTPETWSVAFPADFRINGKRVSDGPGAGDGWTWSYDSASGEGLLTLNQATNYTLTGYSDGVKARVDVTANATIELSGAIIRAGVLGREIFNIAAPDVRVSLGGSNEVYATDGSAVFGVKDGAALTLEGDGALWGGLSAAADCLCVKVEHGGAFTMDGGAIRGYVATADASVVLSSGTTTIRGGVIADNGGTALLSGTQGTLDVRGGVFANNGSTTLVTGYGKVYGGVYDTEPPSFPIVTGSEATKVGDLFVVGANVTQQANQLTGGVYTFDPKGAEYAAAGLKVRANSTTRPLGTTPETYEVYRAAEFRVNGVLIGDGPDEGWTFDEETMCLTLAAPMGYALTGYCDLPCRIDVLSNATVTLDNIRIRAGTPGREIFRVLSEDATFVLKGTNTVYASDGNAAVCVAAGAKLKVRGQGSDSGDGDCLVGGRADGANGRGFSVTGELVLEGGTIRDYYVPYRWSGAGVYCTGKFTMNGGAIATCRADWGAGLSFADSATGDFNAGTISGCYAFHGSAFVHRGRGTVNVRSGMVICNNTNTWQGGHCLACGSSTLNVWGGDFRGQRGGSMNGGVVATYGSSTAAVNVYGGVMSDNAANFRDDAYVTVYGGVYDQEPLASQIASDFEVQSIGTLKAGWYAVARSGTVACTAEGLTGGVYAFDPTNAEYAAADVVLAEEHEAVALGTSPETYRVDWIPVGFTVDGTDVACGSGTGWTYSRADGLLTLGAAREYTLAGACVRDDLELAVTVDAAATVTVERVTILGADYAATRAPVTVTKPGTVLRLSGWNTVHSADDYAAIVIEKGATLALAGDGILAGGRRELIPSRCFDVEGALTMDGGTIRDYCATYEGGAVFVSEGGLFTMNGGAIIRNETTDSDLFSSDPHTGGGVSVEGAFVLNGGTFSENVAVDAEYFGGNHLYAYADAEIAVYGGIVYGTDSFSTYSTQPYAVCGGLFETEPESVAEGYAAQSVPTLPEGWSVVAQTGTVESDAGFLTGGTFTFCPTNGDYAAMGLAVARIATLTEHPETTPPTYVVSSPAATGVTVDGLDVRWQFGPGWMFANGLLSLTNVQDYVIAGTNTEGAVRVNVTADAAVTLRDLTLVGPDAAPDQIRFSASGRLILEGTNTVYAKDGAASVAVHGSLTIDGSGELVGGAASGVGARGIWSVGTLVLDGGTVRGYSWNRNGSGVFIENGSFTMNGGVIRDCHETNLGGAVYNKGTFTMKGGSILGCSASSGGAVYSKVGSQVGTFMQYGGVMSACSATTSAPYVGLGSGAKCKIYGGVSDAAPDAGLIVGGSAATQVGSNWIVGQGVAQADGKLTGGTYTFCPTNAEYAAAGVALAKSAAVTEDAATSPVTWTIGLSLAYPDYLAPWSVAVTNRFDAWAETFGSRDPDGVYTNAFLLNVATNREAEAVGAFAISAIAVTNGIVDIALPKPLAPATAFNGAAHLQCATNFPSAEWNDVETGRYVEEKKSFFRLKLDFEHVLTPETFPTEPAGTKTIRVFTR